MEKNNAHELYYYSNPQDEAVCARASYNSDVVYPFVLGTAAFDY
jgi:hypothetical protein